VASSLLTINMVTAQAVMIFKNSNAFMQNIDTQYDPSFAVAGAKIGASLRIRLPVDYVVRDGPGLSAQDTVEQSIPLPLATQRGVDLTFSSAEETLSVDDYSERFLLPAMNNLAGNVASTIMAGSEGGICNIVANVDGSNNILTPQLSDVNNGRAVLADNSAPQLDRKFVLDPHTMSRLTSSLSGLLNPASDISKQYRDGVVYQATGFTWMEDQTAIKHVTGTFSAGGTVNGANQTGTALLVNATTGTLNQGDIILLAGVNSVNRVTKQSNQTQRQFVVTANVASGATTIPIYPAITPGGAGYQPTTGLGAVQYQTVDYSPANGAAMTLFTNASSTFRKNIMFAPQAITMVTADLIKPKSVIAVSRKEYDGIAIRTLQAYIPGTDQEVTRTDCLFGYVYVRPEWGVIIADAI
jgi:hypothetical protein